ncbi:hypothetical protein INR77_12720 [Erythrobacter sp. SCSIO 43205]|uniref:NAD-dependent epimerase/dehydratase family protein n=1 Tax=Erythrobacter sp. SCSIO 43205 TaxID=2779361 RepID=UPI001CA8B3A3|nr:NAD-dependent epimerase/dehydratase family protein [Erythrobacter sp. SCSIO 43205]UAB77640.1 hypothetical protein INR77_12720 [Erythrobacter sp. SCSIO 43205]
MAVTNSCEGQSGLIGATGFVGGALLRQTDFDAQFNSRTINEIEGQSFDTLVCAAAPGSMIEANTAPERDRAQIQSLINHLSKVDAKRFVLISSIAVLADFAGGDDETTNKFQESLAYGHHRRELEAFIEEHFENYLIVRLPALFGKGLRKNFIFDLMNPVPSMLAAEKLAILRDGLRDALSQWTSELYTKDAATGLFKLDREALNRDERRMALDQAVSDLGLSATQFHNRETTYQYYEIDRLWRDIGMALEAGLTHLHLTSEPLQAAVIHQRLTNMAMPETSARLHCEDMHSAHGNLWGASGPYLFSGEATLDRLEQFYISERAGV